MDAYDWSQFHVRMYYPAPLGELVRLCGASPWIADQLARYPVLLDELLDRASLYSAPDKALLAREPEVADGNN